MAIGMQAIFLVVGGVCGEENKEERNMDVFDWW
jgi:hypothetical protein